MLFVATPCILVIAIVAIAIVTLHCNNLVVLQFGDYSHAM